MSRRLHHGPPAARRRRIKARLAERDGLACFYCGHSFTCPAEATIDHLVPRSVLPGWLQANLVLACQPCNQAKADQLPQRLLRPSGYGPGLTRADRATAAVPATVTTPSGGDT